MSPQEEARAALLRLLEAATLWGNSFDVSPSAEFFQASITINGEPVTFEDADEAQEAARQELFDEMQMAMANYAYYRRRAR